ncbi:hypothetical protein BDV38DRAFT_233060 [Aspergillus pseudotamarii]|uniref:Secreted protein n=1 Tax=Aspergillus pseudotamarii TaxID=132259 RepID=A0A5N6TA89_ASPPS|nr:uncharacterized protein BDV38DRAFT_233060 [Aspergillus pseudotamarii]KAE8143233.1 hypothetical protein BDV38DRAFT_233060 [Aspergillus pseudotamarii]
MLHTLVLANQLLCAASSNGYVGLGWAGCFSGPNCYQVALHFQQSESHCEMCSFLGNDWWQGTIRHDCLLDCVVF